jgi:outer membrane protein
MIHPVNPSVAPQKTTANNTGISDMAADTAVEITTSIRAGIAKTGKRSLLGLIATLTIICSLPASAANLAEIYDLAVNNDPQLAAAKAGYMAQKEVKTQARAGLLPNISVAGTTADNKIRFNSAPGNLNFNDNRWAIIITQPVFRLDRWFQLQQSKNVEAQAKAQFTAEQQQLIFRAADSYLNILEAQDRYGASVAERDAVQRQLEQVQQRFDVGLVAITDVLESTAAFDSSTVNVIEAEGAQAISFESLLRLTGQSFRQVESLSAKFPVEYPEPRDEEAWVNTALQQNFSLIAAREAVNSARKQIQITRSAHLPTIDANINYNESRTGGFAFTGSATDARIMEFQLNVPVYSGGRVNSQARQAGFQLEQQQRNFDLTQRTVVENTRSLYTAINTDVARVNARQKGIDSSQSALDATQTGYEVGTRNIVDVLLAQQRLYQAQFQYASARYQYIRDTLRLKEVVGTLSPEDIYALNNFIAGEQGVGKIIPTTR